MYLQLHLPFTYYIGVKGYGKENSSRAVAIYLVYTNFRRQNTLNEAENCCSKTK